MPSRFVTRFAWKPARAHAPARAVLLAAVGLCLAAALVPRASSGSAGVGGGGAAVSVGRVGEEKRAGVEFAPGEVLVQFRAGAANPVESNAFFVRQQYLDFLSREPEPSGFEAWKGVLDRCPNAGNDPACDRQTVSGSFFRSQEFELKGYFVYRFYKAMLGSIPLYEEFVIDMRAVTGQTAGETTERRDAFAAAWMARGPFRARYDRLSNVAFVHQLMDTAGVGTAGGASRDSLAADLQAGTKSRAEVVRLVVESREVDAREYNGAFVAMQYYGYLRRTPEQPGYQNWLNYLNANPTDFRTMVTGFVNSTEYRLRFGQP